MSPLPRTKDQLIDWLDFMLAQVRCGDSLEGSISFTQPTEQDPPCDFMVHAVLRTGNLMGQGSMMMVGLIEPASASTGPGEQGS